MIESKLIETLSGGCAMKTLSKALQHSIFVLDNNYPSLLPSQTSSFQAPALAVHCTPNFKPVPFPEVQNEIPIDPLGGVRPKTPPSRLFISYAARSQCP